MVGRPRHALFIAVSAENLVLRRTSAILRRQGFVSLIPGLYWTSSSGRDVNTTRLAALRHVRRAARRRPCVAVSFIGHAPLDSQSAWLRLRGDTDKEPT